MARPKTKFQNMSNEELLQLLASHREQSRANSRNIGAVPITIPIQDWIAVRDANQVLLHEIALIEQELSHRGKS